MSENTRIEWTHHSFNLWSGCAKISAGCANCYAAAAPPSMRRGATWGQGEPRIPASEEYWRQPLRWNRAAEQAGERRRVFCASMADVFEDRADLDPWRARLWSLIASTPWLDWLLLTKRPEKMLEWSRAHPWPSNAWAGTSVENQEAADARILTLLKVPAHIRFLSCEPLLGPVDVSPYFWCCPECGPKGKLYDGGLACYHCDEEPTGIDWVIVGGESGRRARPMHPDWARSLRDQCVAAAVPFHFKQWGEWAPSDQGADRRGAGNPALLNEHGNLWEREKDQPTPKGERMVWKVGKHAAGRLLDGRTWDEAPR